MIVQKKFTPYPNELLPNKFLYPKKYLEVSENPSFIEHTKDYDFHWWFEDYGTESAEIAYKFRNSDVTGLNLIPFANNGDWQAYFDGDDTSGNPKVIVVDLTDLPFHIIYNNFEEWLDLAIKDTW